MIPLKLNVLFQIQLHSGLGLQCEFEGWGSIIQDIAVAF